MLQGSILQQLAAAHTEKRPLNFGVYYKNTLVALCHALEDCILTTSTPPLVITAFQRGKWYLQEADRYHELAQKSQQVAIMAAPDAGFAEHPTSQLGNVDILGLDPKDPVAQEWHLIIMAPSYTAMVLCQELSEEDYGKAGQPDTDLERKFYGFWTFEPTLVQETVDIAIAHINKYDPELAQKLTTQAQEIAALIPTTAQDDLGEIVHRVVDYLQTSEIDVLDGKIGTHQQALDNNLVSNELQAFLRLAQLIDIADTNNQMAAAEVATLAETIGQMLDLPAWQLKRLRLAGLLHRVAPCTVTVEYGDAPSCPLVPAAQVLRTMPRMSAIAQIITHQNEWWDGNGQPAGLAGEKIPLESRILGLAATFQQRVMARQASQHSSEPVLLQVLSEFRAEENTIWEPKLIDTLELLVMGLQQGLNLSVSSPKISAGMWLIDTQQSTDKSIEQEERASSRGY
ncbi:DICT sensory domain-containing protein [Aliterella atlantica]|uniref:Metal-dependent phosphohydrolase n=1 Tax=Aliterella atlantica CENA595 TaxID=1618023 RepID=A0A0D8ZW00_9CYAN|nr:DICT sensory domain-containing protein [Aliterella atlantica]KJH72624.1 metal-dependent phosphohydrolase [Aliterella atlantica CENA595]